jgi:hypothetical protein
MRWVRLLTSVRTANCRIALLSGEWKPVRRLSRPLATATRRRPFERAPGQMGIRGGVQPDGKEYRHDVAADGEARQRLRQGMVAAGQHPVKPDKPRRRQEHGQAESLSCAGGAEHASHLAEEYQHLHETDREQHLEGHRCGLRGAAAERQQQQTLNRDEQAEDERGGEHDGDEVCRGAVKAANRAAVAGGDHCDHDRLRDAHRRREQQEDLSERGQPGEHEPVVCDRQRAEDAYVPAIRKHAVPDDQRHETDRDHRQSDQDDAIRIEDWMANEQRIAGGRRCGEKGSPEHELDLRQALGHQIALEHPREERPGQQPRLAQHLRPS